MTQPTIAGIHKPIMTGPFFLILVAIIPLPRIATNWTAPKGVLNKIVVNLSYPKAEMMRGPKVVIPPLIILQRWLVMFERGKESGGRTRHK
jgi:hypothetical protein